MRNAARVDAGQSEVVKALRAIGCCVYVVGLPLDLLVSYRRPGEHATSTLLIEVKEVNGRLTKTQEDFIGSWIGEVHVVRGPIEAVAAVLGPRLMR